MLAISLSPELETILDQRAKEKGQTAAEYARRAVVEYLEDAEDIAEAESRLAEIDSGRARTYSLEGHGPRHARPRPYLHSFPARRA